MKSFALCVLLLPFLGAYAQPKENKHEEKLFSSEQLQQDFDSLYYWLQSSHPDLHLMIDKQTTDKKWQDVRKKLVSPMSRIDFMKLVVPLTTQYKDGHTALYMDPWSEELKEYEKGGGTFFPLLLHLRDGRAWIQHDAQPAATVTAGDELIAINNKPVKEMIREMLAYWPGDGLRYNETVLSRFFSITLWYLYGWGPDVNVELQSANATKSIRLQGVPSECLQKKTQSKPDWLLHMHNKESLAVIECNSYGSMKKAMVFLDSAFAQIRLQGIRNVALDLRKNEGGNSSIGDLVLSYVSRKSFRPFTQKKMFRFIPLAASEDNSWVRQMLATASRQWQTEGEYYVLNIGTFSKDSLINKENIFNGKFYLLTSGSTFSSAHMTAIEVKCYSLGTIIGEPTGERLNLSGEMMGFVLPNTGLNGSCASASYTTPCGDPRQVGVEPDIHVPFNPKAFANGRDMVMEKLRSLL